jgi:drug/metabolite transporter (DMT)-like permease
MTKTHKAMLAAFGGNFIFGLSFLFTKTALQYTTPSVLLALRFLLAFAVMNVLLLTGKVKVSFKGKPIGWLVLMGVFQPVLYFYFENYGLLYSNATFSSVMIALVPIASLIFGALFMKEHPTVLQILCSVVSVGGVVFMALRQSAGGAITVWGVLLLLGAVISAVGFNVISRRSAGTVTAFERTYMMFLIGTVAFGGVAVAENITAPLQLVTPLGNTWFLVSLLYLGVLSSVGAFLMINYANTYLPLSRATVFSNVVTVVSVFAGVVLLKESFDIWMLFATAMIILGIAGVQYFVRKN